MSALSGGTNALLRLGAAPVTRAEDVLEPFGLDPAARERPPIGPDAEALLGRLRFTVHNDAGWR